MIMFVEDTNIQELSPLLNGELHQFNLNGNPSMIYNLSSPSNIGTKLNIIPDSRLVNIYDDRTFDTSYANYILSNDHIFVSFFDMIYHYYLGYNILILVSEDIYDARQRITESLMKFIQERYNIISRYVACMEDIPEYYDREMHYVDGMFNLDRDKERYIYLTTSNEDLARLMEDDNDQSIMGENQVYFSN